MNRMHRSLWSPALGAWVAVPENVRARGKRGGSARIGAARLGLLASACLLGWSAPSAFACNASDTGTLASCIANVATDSTITLTADITLTASIGVLNGNAAIDGNGHTLDGANTYRGFFIGAGTASISNLTMQSLRAQGGQGGQGLSGGGGGMGAGAAVFVAQGAAADLRDVTIFGNRAIGGNGGDATSPLLDLNGQGGGGGMGGSGGGGVTLGTGVGNGGGGLFGDGASASAGNLLVGGNGGGPNGGAGNSGNGGIGGAYSGGGGGGFNGVAVSTHGGAGGLGGGGGGSGAWGFDGVGGRGGFGGGGGAGNAIGGVGGFGGGGGGAAGIGTAAGGFGGGDGGALIGGGVLGAGGGGAGMGGAVFVMEGGSLTWSGASQVSGNSVVAGVRGNGGRGQDGSAFGAGIFMQGTGTLAFMSDAGATQTVADAIADQTGSDGTGSNAGSIGLIQRGAGRLVLSGANTYSGGTTISAGTLSVAGDANLGAVSGALTFDGGTLQVTGTAFTSIARGINWGASGGGFDIVDGNARFSVAQALTGTGGLIKQGAGTLVLSGANAYTGGTTNNAGTLVLDATATLAGPVVNNATLDIASANTAAITTIQNNAALNFRGAGSAGQAAITNNATTDFFDTATAGSAVITTAANAATRFHDRSSMAQARFVTAAGGVVDFSQSAGAAGDGQLSAGSIEGAGRYALGANQLTVGGNGLSTVASGAIDGAGGSLIKTGTGTLSLSGANSYSGGTTISAGTLSVAGDANLGAVSGALTFDGGTLQVTGTAFTSIARGINWGASGGGFDIVDGNARFSVAQALTGTGGLIKQGAGTLVLSGADAYTGGTTNNAGTLVLDAMATLAGPVVNNATLDIASANTAAITTIQNNAALNFRGAGSAGQAAITNNATTDFFDTATAGSAVITTAANAATRFHDRSSMAQARFVTAAGGVVDFSQSAGAAGDGQLSAGSIEGAGRYALGANQLTVGGNGLSTVASGAIDGVGGSLIKTGTGTLSLSGANSYSGGTTVTSGTMSISADGNLGAAPGSLNLDGGMLRTTADLTMNRATTLDTRNGTIETLAGTTLIQQGGVGGAGGLIKTGAGTLTLTGENSYRGGTDLKQGSLAVGNNSALGTGQLAMHEGTTLRFAADGLDLANPIAFTDAVDPAIDTGPFTATLTGAITGPGDLSKLGSGTLVLAGANTYSGATAVTGGTLRAGAANTFSAASAHGVASGATLDLAGFSQSIAGLANAGTVSLIGATPGTTLAVTGPYVGNNGLLRLGTFLGDSTSASDRLVLSGPSAVASGRTTVQVVNLGGLGALTIGNGIELISALNGAATTAQSTKDAFALQGGHVDAGAYEYRLQAGDAAGAGENWYLRSTSTIIPPPQPAPPAPPALPAPPAAAPIQVPTYRAEVPLFAALPEQLRQGNLAMLGNLHQRIGDDDVRSAAGAQTTAAASATGERRAWGRVLSTGLNIQQGGTVSPQSDGRLSGLQAGTDLWTHANWRAGLYVGQLDGDMQVKGFARGIANLTVGSNDLRSQYLGGYATYTDTSGFYADGVLQAGRHRYEVKPQANLRTRGKASSLSASLEIGQSFALGEGWQIEPQAQLVHQRVDVDDVDIAGARVQQERDGSWLARVGVRVKGDIATSAGRLQPYGRVNLYRASGGNDSTRFINPAAITAIDSSTGSTSTELATGFTLSLSESTSLYSEVGKLWASGGDTRVKSQLNASAGLRVHW
ncbi:Outer membrane protein IcsA autotransporter precursor [Variovorax sp. PBL-H6]|uniref:autotransporter-associated beta strand repeat-containing protein n=1 Tax=Variovorax sp. PBL-H6 TaxID=434009 RepID=UPI0013171B11|nr:autotransporter-associated beta strand repeat-containing protein [Variovorax sp. PBL-H6]VTU34911.1 Outer membrane protein IcsA autotransporter precursor [Variovorax sp. PBL-H6]